MTDIKIRNFQSIGNINFPIKGFTVIYGKNNIGKSAIIRAIKAALTNQTGKGFIRKGCKQTEIEIKRDDLNILWEKGTKTVYDVNGEKYQNLNRDIPKPLIERGFGKMDIGNKKVLPTIASQFNPLFLIDEHGSTITEVLASLYNIDTLSIADDLCQKSLRSQKILLTTREKDTLKLKEKLEKYKDFDKIKEEVESLLAKEKQVNVLESDISEISVFENDLLQLSVSLKKTEPIQKINIPDVSIHEENFLEINNLRNLEQEYTEKTSNVKNLKDIDKIIIPSTEEIEDLSKEVKLLAEYYEQFTALEKAVKQKEDILKELDINNITKSYKYIERDHENLLHLTTIVDMFMSMVTSAKKTREELRIATKEYDEKYTLLSKEICPTCERPYGN